ncbi:hypothetical protein [Horticoccus sp. 23ND18S-11]
MPIEYQKWSPIDNMPERFLNAAVQSDDEGTRVVLLPFGEGARALCVQFNHVLAYAVYDDFAFALSDIEYGLIGVPTFIVRNYDWPAPHKRYEDTGLRDVICYRFGSLNTIVDVLAAGPVNAHWIPPNG